MAIAHLKTASVPGLSRLYLRLDNNIADISNMVLHAVLLFFSSGPQFSERVLMAANVSTLKIY